MRDLTQVAGLSDILRMGEAGSRVLLCSQWSVNGVTDEGGIGVKGGRS